MPEIKMEACLPGMVVRVTRDNMTWEGTVILVKKVRGLSMLVDCPTIIIDGTVRHKWKRKNVTFGLNRSITIELDQAKWDAERDGINAKRKAYKDARKILAQRRIQSTDDFARVGLTKLSTVEELRLVQRKLMKKFHPDVVAGAKIRGEDVSSIEQEAKEIQLALARVEAFLKARDGN